MRPFTPLFLSSHPLLSLHAPFASHKQKPKAPLTSYVNGTVRVANNEGALQAAVADRPLTVTFGVTRDFQLYKSVSGGINGDDDGVDRVSRAV